MQRICYDSCHYACSYYCRTLNISQRSESRTCSLVAMGEASEEQLTNEQAALQAELKREKQLAATWSKPGRSHRVAQ
jgi:hypothetical protein